MSDRTFFFRQEYSIKEIYDRIYAENFIECFREYAAAIDDGGSEGSVELNKNNCFTGLYQTYGTDTAKIHHILLQAFEEFGRKGDRLNIKLFRLDPNIIFVVNEQVERQIYNIIENLTSIKDIDYLSPGLKYDLFIDKVKITQDHVDFKFRAQTYIFILEPTPFKQVQDCFVEARFYLSSRLIAIFNSEGTSKFLKEVLKVIHLLFQPYSPVITEVAFDEAQLIMIQLKLNGQVSSPKLKSQDEIRVDLYGINEINYQNPIVKLVQENNSLRIYELTANCLVHGHRFNLRLTEEGRIQIETYVSPDVLDRIITDIEWVIFSEKYYKELDKQVDGLYKRRNPGSLQAHRVKKIKAVQDSLNVLLEKNKSKNMQDREAKVVCTILLNIGHLMCDCDIIKLISEEIGNYDISIYEDLLIYFSDHQIVINRKNKNQAELISKNVVKLQQYIIKESKGDAAKMIELFEQLMRE
jgi:hypothetical protein